MPAGIPKNPEVTAAKRAAAVEARRAAKLAAGPGEVPRVKRSYKRRNSTRPSVVSEEVKQSIASLDRELKGKIRDLEELDAKYASLIAANEKLRDRLIESENRLMTVLDLISMVRLHHS